MVHWRSISYSSVLVLLLLCTGIFLYMTGIFPFQNTLSHHTSSTLSTSRSHPFQQPHREFREQFSVPHNRTIAFGAYIPPAPADGGTAIDTFTALVGARPAMVMWYDEWGHHFDPNSSNQIIARGASPILTWSPHGPYCSDRQVANGSEDSYFHQYAHDVASWGKPLYIRLAWEMNGDWSPWAPGVNGNTDADFIAMWQHIVTLFRADGATNVRWIWAPNVTIGAADFTHMYPGDAYVDWVGLDGYNWGITIPTSSWTSFTAIFNSSYQALLSLTNKPIMVAETGCSEDGGNKAVWLKETFLTAIPDLFPHIQAVIWFNEKKETDWRVNSSPEALSVFRTIVSSPLYKGHFS